MASGDVTSSTFFLMGSNSSLLIADSLIVTGVFVGVWGFPYLILVLFLVLKYMVVCICLFFLGLIGVLKAAREVIASFSVGPGEKLFCSGDTSSSLGVVVFLGLGYSWCSSSSSSFFPFSTSSFFSGSSILSASSSSSASASSSSYSSTSSSSSASTSSPSGLEVGVSPSARSWVSRKCFLSISMNVD